MTPKENQKSARSAGKVSAWRKRVGTLRWARGREGCSDSPLPASGLHPPRNATTATAASGRNREQLLGQRPARRKCRPRHDADAGCRNPLERGCSPLTILKKKSKHKKASAAPVGAIALTLFSLLHLKAPQSLRDSSPRGASAAAAVCRHDPSCENGAMERPQAFHCSKIKIILPLILSERSGDNLKS